MIKQLFQEDKGKLLKYALDEPEYNIFLIGDMENYGIYSPEVSVYAQIAGGEYKAILLRYFEDFMIYSRDDAFEAREIADFLKSAMVKGDIINGKYSCLERLFEYYPGAEVEKCFLCRLDELKSLSPVPPECEIRLLEESDVEEYVRMFLKITEFSSNATADEGEMIQRTILKLRHGDNIFGAFSEGKLVSCAGTTAKNSMSAMVSGVATLSEYRNRGIASGVVSKLCEYELSRGAKFLCLFYDNPEAGRIYNRLGFLPRGLYGMMKV